MSLLFTLQEKIAKEGGLSEWDAREDCHEDAPQRAGRLFLMHYGQASAGEAAQGWSQEGVGETPSCIRLVPAPGHSGIQQGGTLLGHPLRLFITFNDLSISFQQSACTYCISAGHSPGLF